MNPRIGKNEANKCPAPYCHKQKFENDTMAMVAQWNSGQIEKFARLEQAILLLLLLLPH